MTNFFADLSSYGTVVSKLPTKSVDRLTMLKTKFKTNVAKQIQYLNADVFPFGSWCDKAEGGYKISLRLARKNVSFGSGKHVIVAEKEKAIKFYENALAAFEEGQFDELFNEAVATNTDAE